MQLKGLKYYDDIQKKIPYNEMVKHEKYLKKSLKELLYRFIDILT